MQILCDNRISVLECLLFKAQVQILIRTNCLLKVSTIWIYWKYLHFNAEKWLAFYLAISIIVYSFLCHHEDCVFIGCCFTLSSPSRISDKTCCGPSCKYVTLNAWKNRKKSEQHSKDKREKPTNIVNNTYSFCSLIREKFIKIV